MRITIAGAGKFRRGPERALYETFAERLSWPIQLKEFEDRAKLGPQERRS